MKLKLYHFCVFLQTQSFDSDLLAISFTRKHLTAYDWWQFVISYYHIWDAWVDLESWSREHWFHKSWSLESWFPESWSRDMTYLLVAVCGDLNSFSHWRGTMSTLASASLQMKSAWLAHSPLVFVWVWSNSVTCIMIAMPAAVLEPNIAGVEPSFGSKVGMTLVPY